MLLALVAAGYFVRLAELPVRAEEPRWRRSPTKFSSAATGSYHVSRANRSSAGRRCTVGSSLPVPICSARAPPGAEITNGARDTSHNSADLRLFANFPISPGALTAAAAFATFGEMFSTGFQAETEGIFIPLVSASLLLWSWGQVARLAGNRDLDQRLHLRRPGSSGQGTAAANLFHWLRWCLSDIDRSVAPPVQQGSPGGDRWSVPPSFWPG